MKNNVRSKIKRFLQSEDGRVSAKAPLAVGVATGSVLLAQMMLPSPAEAHLTCHYNADCSSGEVCEFWYEIRGGRTIWHSECVPE